MRAAACLAVVWLSAVSLVACGDDDGGGAQLSVEKLVGPEGGTVELPNGGKVTIPAGALTEATKITISELKTTDVAAVPNTVQAAGKPYAFKPHGQVFQQSVKIEVPYEGSSTDVTPLKLPNETADSSEWMAVDPFQKDTANSKLSMDTTSFSVIVAVRPRSGVITLPDGAVDDASTSDAGADSSTATDAGSDAAVGTDAGTDAAVADAGSDAAVNTTPCTATAVGVTAVPPAGAVLANGGRVMVTNGNVLTAYTGTGAALSSAGTLIMLDAASPETFNDVSTGGAIVAAVSERSSSSGRVAIAPVDGTSGATFYDLIDYAEHAALFDQRPAYAYSPTARQVTTDGTVVAVAMSTGSLILFSAATAQPLGMLADVDFNASPVGGAVAMELTGNYLVAAIDRMGINITPLKAIRVFDISSPTDITMVDEAVRTDTVHSMIADPARNRFLLSNLAGGQVLAFTVDGSGNIGADMPVATGQGGAQARAMAVVGDLLLLGNPNFTVQPVDCAISVFGLVGDGSVPRGVIDVPDGDYGTGFAVSGNSLYSIGSSLGTIDLTSCLTP